MRVQAALTLFLIAGCARQDPSLSVGPAGVDLAAELQGRTAGAAQACIGLRDVRSTRLANGGEAILFADGRGGLYVNRPHGGCTVSPGGHLRTESLGTRLCRGDSVEVVGPGDSGSDTCTLTDFVPYSSAG